MIPRAYEDRVCEYCGYRDISVYLKNDHAICPECWKSRNEKAISEYHHVYGRTKNVTVQIPANLHAYITLVRNSWPKVISRYPDDPILQIAYAQRHIYDLVGWCLNHPEKLENKTARPQVFRLIQECSRNFEIYSDWLIALQAYLVKVNGTGYFQTMGIAPLLTQPFDEGG
jgi:hypothetical protein